MTNILVDTNVVLDLLAKREPFYVQSLELFSLADIKKVQLIVSTLSIVNAQYILNDSLKISESRSIISKFKVLVTSYELNDKIIELAISDRDFKDFEDGIQYYTALESKCEVIVTRNFKDFKKSQLPVFSPEQYLAKIRTQH